MPPIKNTYERLLIQRLKTNCFSRKRNPSPIKVLTLSKALLKVNTHKLVKEIAYVLSTDFSYRLLMQDKYILAFNSIPLKNWENIAVVQLKKDIKTFDSIVCVDIKEYTTEFKQNNPVFMKLLLFELNNIRKS
jgi:hypothetical protein